MFFLKWKRKLFSCPVNLQTNLVFINYASSSSSAVRDAMGIPTFLFYPSLFTFVFSPKAERYFIDDSVPSFIEIYVDVEYKKIYAVSSFIEI